MVVVQEAMERLREAVDAGDAPELTVREIARWYGAPKLSLTLRWKVREDLARHGLRVSPALDDASLDTILSVRADGVSPSAPYAARVYAAPVVTAAPAAVTARDDRAICLADVADCLERAEVLAPDAPLARVRSVLATRGVSCVVVATGKRMVRGVVTWERVGRAAMTESVDTTAGQWMAEAESALDVTPLFDAVALLDRAPAVVVIRADRTFAGVLTQASATAALRRVVAPFALLDEIERRLRARIASRAPSMIAPQRGPTFGEYLRVLEDPKVYPLLGLGAEREEMRALVDDVRGVRNRCMHFAPEGIGPDDLRTLTRLLSFLRDVR